MAQGKRRRGVAAQARIAWDRSIEAYDDFQESGKDHSRDRVHGPALLKAIGPIRGRRVLDLGCGQGRFTRSLARRGAKVTGIDWSREMIARAQAREARKPLGIDFRAMDARSASRAWAPGTFDLVVGCMSLMDMPDLPRVLRGAHRLLRPRGRLVFSIAHPVNTAADTWERDANGHLGAIQIDRYFEERTGITHWTMPRLKRPFDTIYWHRPLESWFKLLGSSGFAITGLSEPRATKKDIATYPELECTGRIPFFLVLAARRESHT